MPQFTIMRFTNTASVAFLEADSEEQAQAMASDLPDTAFTVSDTDSYNTVIAN